MNDSNPIKKALGTQWNSLPEIIKFHYSSDQKLRLEGQMDEVWHSNIASIFIFFSRFLNALIPYKGKTVPTIAYNWLSPDRKIYYFLRQLKFPDKKLIEFPSKVVYFKENQVIEYVKFGVGLRMSLHEENGNLVFKILSYVQNLGLFKVYIPSFLLLGGGFIREKVVEGKTIRVEFELNHPLYGKTFAYSGNFEVKESE